MDPHHERLGGGNHLRAPIQRGVVVSMLVILQQICSEMRTGSHADAACLSARILLSVTSR
jgi:hypothetical protein